MSALDPTDGAEVKAVQVQTSSTIHDEDVASKEQGLPSTSVPDKKLLRRIDLHVMPFLCILYALSLIDRTNLSSAKVAGMDVDLVLTGSRYSVVALVFFPIYILVEIPTNSVLRWVGTRKLLSGMIFCWGVVAMCCGFVKSYEQLIGVRILLGFFEGGFNPACIYIITCWYKRYETQQRLAVWYVFGAAVNGFNGVLSYGLSKMEGAGGLRGWRWIFIIPGLVTAVLAVPIYLYITEFPEKAKWLKSGELEQIQDRIQQDRGEVYSDRVSFKSTMEALCDWKCWSLALLFFWVATGSYSLSFFTPSILKGLGYSTALSQILVTPPYLLAVLCSVAASVVADRVQHRSPFIIFFMVMTIVGLIMIAFGNNLGCKLTGLFIAICGNNSAIPAVIAFLANNIPQSNKRAIAVPLQTGFSGLGGIAGSLIFREQDYPRYLFGIYASLTSMSICIAMTLLIVAIFRNENKKAEMEGKILQDTPGFRYTL
ncbi:hypothetical protein AYO21_00610 [Fonsecaea monophora]|uniref:Major facilitator superfamily (MFS) profile domain-containing protein n=1 Tax=Fonsecaea monophora TaxID=254056 RepID=A0A177FPI8_9EURO|nr:hypothetical protein AYO21_00610 [Fonsecaea monophora]OAG45262.1 hypothetical protein AYO21_00610 [Fonsecaea monophora]